MSAASLHSDIPTTRTVSFHLGGTSDRLSDTTVMVLAVLLRVDAMLGRRFRCEGRSEDHGASPSVRVHTLYLSDIFCILSPVWTLESCVLETGMNLDGWRRQLRAVRRSADINVALPG